jgi:hypothetical protein
MRRVALVLSLLALVAALVLPRMAGQAASSFADPKFQQQWEQGEAITPNFWGPLSAARDGQQEPYKEAQGGKRLVQYFDKGRMELTNGTVTNGLLATEIIKGQIQVGDGLFEAKDPPAIPMAGDPDNQAPTYAQLTTKAASLLAPATAKVGQVTTAAISTTGDLTTMQGDDPSASSATQIAAFDAPTQHNVPGAFNDYRQQAGLLTIGYAISEPFLAMVKVGGTPKRVMVQAFERRILTYTSANPIDFRIEMGNIGQHYYRWRYVSGTTSPLIATPAGATVPVIPVQSVGAATATKPPLLLSTPFVPAKSDGYTCKDFPSQSLAQRYLRFYPDDPSGLDPNRTGVACPNNPGPYDTTPVKRT